MFTSTLFALALAPTLGSSAADVQSEDIFPEETFFFAQAENIDEVVKRFGDSAAWKTIGDGQPLDSMIQGMMAMMADDPDIDPSELSMPSEVGLCSYVSFDEDLGIEVPAYLLHIEFAGKPEMAKGVYENRLDEMTANGDVDFDKEEIRGREMIVVESSFEMPAMSDFMDMGGMMMPIGGDTDFMNDALSRVYMVRDGDRMLVGSDPIAIDGALGIIDGAKGKCLADNDEYQSLLDMIPEDGRDLKAMILTSEINPVVGPLAGPMIGPVMPIILELFGDIRGYGFWGDVANGSSVMELGVAMMIDGDRLGLIKLLDVSEPVGEIPAFVPEAAIGYSRMDFDFKGLVPTIRQILSSLPEGEAQQIEPMFEQFAPLLQGGLETLGPEIHVFAVETDSPFSPTRTTLAIPTSNAEALEQVFAMLAPAAGLMPRDFNGETIYSDPLDEFSQMAVGIGGGNLVVGQAEGVEAVLRSVGQKGLPKMEDTDSSRTVRRALPGKDLMGWGMMNLAKQFDPGQAMMMMPMLMGQGGMDMADLQDQMMPMMDIDEESMAEVFGSGWWFMESTDAGMIFRTGILAPGE